MPKYKLEPEGNLFRIIATRDIINKISSGNVKKGDKGGLVSGPSNLSQKGSCWIDNNSLALNDSRVTDSALLIDSLINGKVLVKEGSLMISSIIKGDEQYGNGLITFKYIDAEKSQEINSESITETHSYHDWKFKWLDRELKRRPSEEIMKEFRKSGGSVDMVELISSILSEEVAKAQIKSLSQRAKRMK